ncbi:hypothetical protein [Embleya sp. AB8]|uniref:hypothetical protein n=1 Tax=Embleya sp. AB8 TaxID=3156304 RepID=UPI003C74C44C
MDASYRWAAHQPDFAHRGALLLRTDPENPHPGRWAGAHDIPQGPATDWHTDIGTVRLVHRIPENQDHELLAAGWAEVAAATHPDAVAVLAEAFHQVPPRLPFGNITTAPATAPVAQRWARRLTVCDPPPPPTRP